MDSDMDSPESDEDCEEWMAEASGGFRLLRPQRAHERTQSCRTRHTGRAVRHSPPHVRRGIAPSSGRVPRVLAAAALLVAILTALLLPLQSATTAVPRACQPLNATLYCYRWRGHNHLVHVSGLHDFVPAHRDAANNAHTSSNTGDLTSSQCSWSWRGVRNQPPRI